MTGNALTARFEKTPPERVEELVRLHFGLPGRISILNSERDETFLLTSGPEQAPLRHVVKLASPSERHDILAFQTGALKHLALKSLPVPVPVPVLSRQGEAMVTLETAEGPRILRVLTYLGGTLLYRASPSLPQVAALGRALASLGAGLADYRPAVPQQVLLWDLQRSEALRPLLPHVAPERQAMVERILDAVAALADGPLRQVRRQVIHNDFNPHNILVDEADPARVSGVIDFGDMVEAPLVQDVAVALSYQVAPGAGLEGILAMLQAYHAVQPLSPQELECLPALIRGRLGMSIAIAEWRAALYPENAPYIMRNHALARLGLSKLEDRSDAALAALFHATAGDHR